jgi:hypothetical protein
MRSRRTWRGCAPVSAVWPPEMTTENNDARPAANGTGEKQADRPGPTVAELAAAEHARRRWRLHQVGARRRISVALDRHCGVELPEVGAVHIDYTACGLTLGWPERVAAGIAMQERAA